MSSSSKPMYQCLLNVSHSNLNSTSYRRPLVVRAGGDRPSSASIFVGGFVLGGIVVGALVVYMRLRCAMDRGGQIKGQEGLLDPISGGSRILGS
ncbi:hypothetical protein Prudu_020224 [Prunus dulcis]|uniref:Uncharacterized protein n=1 Tax=Prunus dulcis TaxID=3755 RepID=A0A4Y1RWJ2_PRUDU|nr:hypothetical protein Prudu_020224 [Prunus dulcis]